MLTLILVIIVANVIAAVCLLEKSAPIYELVVDADGSMRSNVVKRGTFDLGGVVAMCVVMFISYAILAATYEDLHEEPNKAPVSQPKPAVFEMGKSQLDIPVLR